MKVMVSGKQIVIDDKLAEEAALHGENVSEKNLRYMIHAMNSRIVHENGEAVDFISADTDQVIRDKTAEELSEDVKKYLTNWINTTKEMKDW